MAIYNKDSRLAEILMNHPSLIPVLSRLGIKLGVGDKTVGDACVNPTDKISFLLSIINTFVDEDYFPSDSADFFSLNKTIDYLEKTDEYYLKIQLPNIEHHFNLLIKKSGTQNNLLHLKDFFYEMKNQMEENVIYELQEIFPQIKKNNFDKSLRYKIIDANVETEEKIRDLLIFFIMHLKGEYDSNLCAGVVAAIYSLSKDLHQNNRIRTRIFVPMLEKMCKSN